MSEAEAVVIVPSRPIRNFSKFHCAASELWVSRLLGQKLVGGALPTTTWPSMSKVTP